MHRGVTQGPHIQTPDNTRTKHHQTPAGQRQNHPEVMSYSVIVLEALLAGNVEKYYCVSQCELHQHLCHTILYCESHKTYLLVDFSQQKNLSLVLSRRFSGPQIKTKMQVAFRRIGAACHLAWQKRKRIRGGIVRIGPKHALSNLLHVQIAK